VRTPPDPRDAVAAPAPPTIDAFAFLALFPPHPLPRSPSSLLVLLPSSSRSPRLKPCRRHQPSLTAPQVRVTNTPVGLMSRTSSRNFASQSSLRTAPRRTFSYFRPYSLSFRMFPCFSFVLGSSLPSLAVPYRPHDRTPSATALLDSAPAVAPRHYINSLFSFWIPDCFRI
jgi:hypothetical protein